MTEQQPVRQSARMAIDLARLDELPLNVAQGLVEVVLGTKLNWNGADAPCVCPGLSMHTKPNAPTDCHVIAIKAESGIAPGVYCHHGSCREVCAEVSQTLRKALGTHRVHLARMKALAASSAQGADSPAILTRSSADTSAFDPAKLEAIARKLDGADLEWFAARSPKRPDNRTPASFLYELYAPGERVLVFNKYLSQGQAIFTTGESPEVS